MIRPNVSVCMVTYNHEKYIAQAIESALMQKTNFKFELVIGEDCSIDKTKQIVIRYQNKYPEIIKLNSNSKNLGGLLNFIKTLHMCKGTYIAYLEGDDYWTDPYKLQKQADLLDSNPTYAMCFHTTQAFNNAHPKKTYLIPSKERKRNEYFVEDIVAYNFIASCSVMYRNDLVKKLPSWFNLLKIGDWPLHILYATHGSIGYIDETMAKYRIHDGSYFSSRRRIFNFLDIIKTQKSLDRGLRYKYHDIIRKTLNENYNYLYQEYLRINDNVNARRILKKSMLKIIPPKRIRNQLLHLLSNRFLSKLQK